MDGWQPIQVHPRTPLMDQECDWTKGIPWGAGGCMAWVDQALTLGGTRRRVREGLRRRLPSTQLPLQLQCGPSSFLLPHLNASPPLVCCLPLLSSRLSLPWMDTTRLSITTVDAASSWSPCSTAGWC